MEWRALGEVCRFRRGKSLSKSDIGLGDVPIVLYGELYTTYGEYIKKIYSFTSKERAQKATVATFGDLLLPITSTTKEAVIGKASALMVQQDVYVGGDALVLSHEQNPNFLVHYLNSRIFEHHKMQCVSGTTVTHLSPLKLADILIPLPPLAVQEEIVKILDNFTELTARQKQYEYYRDLILSFEGGGCVSLVEWKRLGELGELVRGNGLQKKDFTPEGIPAIHYGQIYTYYGTWADKTISFVSLQTAMKLKKVQRGDVVLTNTSENLQDVCRAVAYLGEEEAVTGGHATIFKPSAGVLGKYIAYFTQSARFIEQKRKYAKGTKVIDVSAGDMSKFEIPLPPLEEQERIVGILDQFDTLANSISEGLPREIELRQKQYEYYRDLLLNFKRVENVDDLAR